MAGKQASPGFGVLGKGRVTIFEVLLDVMSFQGRKKLARNGSERGKRVYTLDAKWPKWKNQLRCVLA
jgi:hypothetical protein